MQVDFISIKTSLKQYDIYFNNLYLRMKILMVCLGNICRSPLAEGILLHKLKAAGLNWQVDSAGTNGYHVNEPPHRLSQKIGLKHGIDISHQICRRLVATDFDKFDKIYAMAEEVTDEMKILMGQKYKSEKVELIMNEVYPGKNIDVPDPWYGPEAGYEEVFELLDKACEKIIEKAT